MKKKSFLLPCFIASAVAALIAYVAANPPAFGQGSPGWVQGFVPTPLQWNTFFAKKVDVTNGLSNGQTINNPKSINGVNDPVSTQDVANKRYVDNHITGQTPQQGVLLATTAALATNTYNNGTAGVGATITITAHGALSINSTTVPLNARVLIKDEADGTHNGCYVQTTLGDGSTSAVLTRCTDWDESGEMSPFSFFFASSGTAPPSGNAATGWTMLTPTPVTVGSTSLSFSQSSQTQAYTASTGLGLSGNAFRILTTGVAANTYGDGTHIPAITLNTQGDATAASNVSIGPNLPIAGYFAASGTGPDSSSTTNSVLGENQIRFRQNPGEEPNSGIIDHGNIDPNALSIIGKGNSGNNRVVNVYDRLNVFGDITTSSNYNTTLGVLPWTPGDASGGGIAITYSDTVYRKGPGFCIVAGHIAWPNNSNGAVAQIGGLPCTAMAGVASVSGGATASTTGLSSGIVGLWVTPGGTTFRLQGTSGGIFSNADLKNGAVNFTITYLTN